MPSEKVTRILKSAGLSSELITSMSESEAWNYVYSNAAPKKDKASGLEVCFTGFTDTEKAELAQSAKQAQLHVVTTVTKNLSFLCAGDNAGPAKLAKAQDQNAVIFTKTQFEHFLKTGEIAT